MSCYTLFGLLTARENNIVKEDNWLDNPIPGLDQREHIFHLCLFTGISIEYMDITIRDDTWYVLNMQLTTKNRKDGIIRTFLVLALKNI